MEDQFNSALTYSMKKSIQEPRLIVCNLLSKHFVSLIGYIMAYFLYLISVLARNFMLLGTEMEADSEFIAYDFQFHHDVFLCKS